MTLSFLNCLSIVATTRGLLAIDDQGADLVNLAGAVSAVAAPPGVAFADFAGGAVVRGDSGVAWIVGATRERASDVVVRVDADGSLTSVKLGSPRSRALAAAVPRRGLAVIGGSASAALIEIVANGAATALAYAAEATTAGGAVALDERRLLTLGGGSAARAYDLSCVKDCAAAPWGRDVPVLAGPVALQPNGGAVLAEYAVLRGHGTDRANVSADGPNSDHRRHRGAGRRVEQGRSRRLHGRLREHRSTDLHVGRQDPSRPGKRWRRFGHTFRRAR
jgi:hypothetical protein